MILLETFAAIIHALRGAVTSYMIVKEKQTVTSYRLQATSYKLQAASYKLQAASCKLQATSCNIRQAT